MHTVGIKDLKNRLTYYLKLTRQGDKVIVTDRGVPFAIIHSLKELEPDAGTEEKLASLAAHGLMRLPREKAKLSPFKGVKTGGELASSIIIGERR